MTHGIITSHIKDTRGANRWKGSDRLASWRLTSTNFDAKKGKVDPKRKIAYAQGYSSGRERRFQGGRWSRKYPLKFEAKREKEVGGLFSFNRLHIKHSSAPCTINKWQSVNLSPNSIELVEDIMGHCLVGWFLGKFLRWQAVKDMENHWWVPYKLWAHRSLWMIFHFNNAELMDKVLGEDLMPPMARPSISK